MNQDKLETRIMGLILLCLSPILIPYFIIREGWKVTGGWSEVKFYFKDTLHMIRKGKDL